MLVHAHVYVYVCIQGNLLHDSHEMSRKARGALVQSKPEDATASWKLFYPFIHPKGWFLWGKYYISEFLFE